MRRLECNNIEVILCSFQKNEIFAVVLVQVARYDIGQEAVFDRGLVTI